MNNAATSREALLEIAIAMAAETGLGALNIREIAKQGNISVGCVYNYFPSKASLVASTVAKIWEGIFHHTSQCERPQGFLANVRWIFESIHSGSEQYPSFFTMHAMSFSDGGKDEGSAVMKRFLDHLRAGLLQALEADEAIRSDVFTNEFTKDAFVAFVFDSLMMLSMKRAASCDVLRNLIRKAIY